MAGDLAGTGHRQRRRDPDPRLAGMIRVTGLWKIYGRDPARALDAARAGATRARLQADNHVLALADINFQVGRGETYIVMGLSGSGKSTLVRCINRLVAPTAGTVFIDGQDVTRMSASQLRRLRTHKVSMVFQHFGLLPHRRVLDNIMLGLEVTVPSRTERERRARQALELVNLERWADYHPRELSGGMRQRVGLARALAVDPAVLLLDEPFSALDPLIRNEMQAELLRLQERLRKTIIFITHDLDEALRLGDRIGILCDGELLEEGTPHDIALRPRSEWIRRFVERVNILNVLTTGDIMVPISEKERGGPAIPAAVTVGPRVIVREFLRLAGERWPAFVVDSDGRTIGQITRERLTDVLADRLRSNQNGAGGS